MVITRTCGLSSQAFTYRWIVLSMLRQQLLQKFNKKNNGNNLKKCSKMFLKINATRDINSSGLWLEFAFVYLSLSLFAQVCATLFLFLCICYKFKNESENIWCKIHSSWVTCCCTLFAANKNQILEYTTWIELSFCIIAIKVVIDSHVHVTRIRYFDKKNIPL